MTPGTTLVKPLCRVTFSSLFQEDKRVVEGTIVNHHVHESWKRGMDLVLGIPLLVLSLPVMALVAWGVKVSNPGPIFFQQQRQTRGGELFTLMKFRCFKNSRDDGIIAQKLDDPRITPFGKFLRQAHLDEFPQLINVLRGDMSLVGPRPQVLAENQELEKQIPEYGRRHAIKAGLTGLAQVRYRDKEQNYQQMEKLAQSDFEYMAQWSPLLDLKILGQTGIYFIQDLVHAFYELWRPRNFLKE